MPSLPLSSQKAWLVAARRELAKLHPELSWDEFAKLAGVEAKIFKTYRLPEASETHSRIPGPVRATIEQLLIEATGLVVDEPLLRPLYVSSDLLVPSLASLVVRLAQSSLIERRMISGTSKKYGMPVGLNGEDRRAMSALSRACLINGLPDQGAEIHDLLERCTHPLGEWLAIPEVEAAGLANTCLIHAEEGIPTVEAEDLAAGFTGMTARIEEQLFAKFMETVGRYPDATANEYYTKCREFVVRHPVCDAEELKNGLAKEVPATLWILIQQQFYETAPASWAVGDGVPICNNCGNAMKQGNAGLVCRTTACLAANPAKSSKSVPVNSLLRVARGIRQYWVEPGIDEMRLYDALVDKGISAALYPFRDRVDISVEDVGIDLKTYVSPETLGAKFRRGIGGLAHYKCRWLVIPDWQAESVPSYIDRLAKAMHRTDVQCMTVSAALSKLSMRGSVDA